jgi:hypothetical protein
MTPTAIEAAALLPPLDSLDRAQLARLISLACRDGRLACDAGLPIGANPYGPNPGRDYTSARAKLYRGWRGAWLMAYHAADAARVAAATKAKRR